MAEAWHGLFLELLMILGFPSKCASLRFLKNCRLVSCFPQVIRSFLLAMWHRVTCEAQRNQVLLGIITAVAAEILVVNFQIRSRPAPLASPAIAL
jgi:hypothetical protein